MSLLTPAIVVAGEHPVSMWLAEGAHNRVYLLGSVHLLRREDHPLPVVLDAAYEDAEALLMELDMDDIDPGAMQNLSSQLGVLAGDRSLRDLMGEEQYQEATVAAAELDLPFELLAHTEPWLAAITLEQLALMRIGFDPQYGIEMTMLTKASRDGKNITGLESAEEQLTLLDNLSIAAQNELLLETLQESRTIKTEMDGLVKAWRVGDTAYLESNMLADMQAYPELYKALVVDRNQRWVSEIQELLDDDQDYLVIVGALHLIGPDGLPALLKQRNIPTRQMHESF